MGAAASVVFAAGAYFGASHATAGASPAAWFTPPTAHGFGILPQPPFGHARTPGPAPQPPGAGQGAPRHAAPAPTVETVELLDSESEEAPTGAQPAAAACAEPEVVEVDQTTLSPEQLARWEAARLERQARRRQMRARAEEAARAAQAAAAAAQAAQVQQQGQPYEPHQEPAASKRGAGRTRRTKARAQPAAEAQHHWGGGAFAWGASTANGFGAAPPAAGAAGAWHNIAFDWRTRNMPAHSDAPPPSAAPPPPASDCASQYASFSHHNNGAAARAWQETVARWATGGLPTWGAPAAAPVPTYSAPTEPAAHAEAPAVPPAASSTTAALEAAERAARAAEEHAEVAEAAARDAAEEASRRRAFATAQAQAAGAVPGPRALNSVASDEPAPVLDRSTALGAEGAAADAAEWEARAVVLEQQRQAAALERRRRRADAARARELAHRQEARLAELRTSAVADASVSNVRDTLRARMAAELARRTSHCYTLGSLLQALGVTPSGWPFPTQAAVASAYRAAALRFHPDRASAGLSPQQQLYHEEIFKLIARTKQERGIS